MIRYVRMADPKLLTPGRFPTLDALCDRCEALSGFQASWPPNSFLQLARDRSGHNNAFWLISLIR
jgi:hypothetical protein